MNAQQYDAAATAFDTIIAGYPTFQYIDDVRIQIGQAYLYSGKYPEAIDRLAPELTSKTHPENRPEAYYFTGLAQYYQGQKTNNKGSFGLAANTLRTLIEMLTKTPSPDTIGMLESALYYRALAYFERADYPDAETDLLRLTTSTDFARSLSRPDYFLRLGSVYEVETNQAVAAKKSDDEVRTIAEKALMAFDEVAKDPNALVQANDANMSEGGVLFLIAQLDPTTAGYEKALDVFRRVKRKDDLVPFQQDRLDALRKQAVELASEQSMQPGAHNSALNDISLLIAREQTRLDELKSGPDPVIQALIGIAECYVAMKQPDEARTILHRLVSHAPLTPEQQQTVDFQILYSYVLGGQTDDADRALTDYLGKHAGDPKADSISYQIADELMKRKDYDAALQQVERSLRDFPPGKGSYASDAISLKAQILSSMGRTEESSGLVDDFLKANPKSSQANDMLLSRAANETTTGNLPAALADFKMVRDNPAARPDIQAAAGAGYIQTLNSLKRYDDVITEAAAYEAKYKDSKVLPSVKLFAALARAQKHDPGAVAALQDIAKNYPKDTAAPFALVSVVTIYKDAGNAAGMIQADDELRKAYPRAYDLISAAADSVGEFLLKERKFDDAIALYTPLTKAPKPEVAAAANNKIGAVWIAAARSLGYYQSMPLATRGEAEKRLSSAEQAYLGTLKNFSDQLDAVGDAFDGLVTLAKQRRSWGLLKDSEMEGYLTMLETDFIAPEIQARFELAKASLVFVTKDGAKQFPAALDRFKKIIASNPGMLLTRQETNQYGELLLTAKNYPAAIKIYNDLLSDAAPTDTISQGDGYYGLGAAYLARGDVAKARDYFLKLKSLPQDGLWHPHIQDANFGIAFADEQSGNVDSARKIYAQLMQVPGNNALVTKAMLGYGRILEKAGNVIKPAPEGPDEFAIHYYQEPNLLFGPAAPDQSAEGLFDAGQAYEKVGDKTNAKKQYDDLISNYAAAAPDWATKARDAEAKL